MFFLGLRHFGYLWLWYQCHFTEISPNKRSPCLCAPAAGRQYLKDKASEARQRLGRGTAWADWLLGRRWLLSQLMVAVQLILPGKDDIFRFFRPGCLQKYEDVEKFCMEVILYTTCFCLLNMWCACWSFSIVKKCETVATFPFCDTVVDELLVTSLIFHAPSGRWGWLGPLWRTEIRDTPVVWGKHSPRFRVVGIEPSMVLEGESAICVVKNGLLSGLFQACDIWMSSGFWSNQDEFPCKISSFFWTSQIRITFQVED